MPFFDFHCHPGLKPQFADPKARLSPWEQIKAKLSLTKNLKLGINKLFNEVLNSQSNFTQLVKADVTCIGLILHAPEQNVGLALAQKGIVNKGKVTLINKKQLDLIAGGKKAFTLITEELRWILEAKTPDGISKFVLLKKASDFKENQDKTVFGALIIEGLHCFFDDPGATHAKKQYLENFNSFTNTHSVIAINVCHMQQNDFCNHAHGIQFFSPELFYPTGNSITAFGKEMIGLMNKKKILVDLKHMSLKARLELYRMNQVEGEINKYRQPVICTHAGTTGLSIRDRALYLLRKPKKTGRAYEVIHLKPGSRHFKKTYHNCSSINLYDEDIEHILMSGGMIGLSFDQRILGFADESGLPGLTVPHDQEYISEQEATFFLGPDPEALPVWPGDTNVWTAEDFEDLDSSLYSKTQCRFLVNNIIHILWVAGKKKSIKITEAAKQICLGTDFDGLINAIDCCKTTEGLAKLKKDMRKDLKKGLVKIDTDQLDADDLLEDIFYTNGRDFMIKRLKLLNE